MKRLDTYRAKNVEAKWFIFDVEKVAQSRLGRISTRIATLLRGKHKPIYDPSCDNGDFVIVINAEKVSCTSKNKEYHWHTGFPGGLKTETFDKRLQRRPEILIELAVRRMLPKGPLGSKLFKKMKVYSGSEHPHAAQCPEILDIKE